MNSPATTTTTSPVRSFELGTDFGRSVGAQLVGLRLGARFAQCVGLGFAAAFGHGFGEIGEEHGEPEPQRDLQSEAEESGVARGVDDEFDRW